MRKGRRSACRPSTGHHDARLAKNPPVPCIRLRLRLRLRPRPWLRLRLRPRPVASVRSLPCFRLEFLFLLKKLCSGFSRLRGDGLRFRCPLLSLILLHHHHHLLLLPLTRCHVGCSTRRIHGTTRSGQHCALQALRLVQCTRSRTHCRPPGSLCSSFLLFLFPCELFPGHRRSLPGTGALL